MAIAFWNSFFVGIQTMARGISLIMLADIAFTIPALVSDMLDLFPAAVIITQALAIMGYYYVIIRYRPYSKGCLRSVSRLRRSRGTAFQWRPYLRGALLVLIMLTLLAVFVVSGVLLRGPVLPGVHR